MEPSLQPQVLKVILSEVPSTRRTILHQQYHLKSTFPISVITTKVIPIASHKKKNISLRTTKNWQHNKKMVTKAQQNAVDLYPIHTSTTF